MDTGVLDNLLRVGLPAFHNDARVDVDEGSVEVAEDGTVNVRLVWYETDETRRSQLVPLVPMSVRQDSGRVQAYVLAWMRALPSLMARLEHSATFGVPSAVVFPEALTRTAAATPAEFAVWFGDPDALDALDALRAEAELRADCVRLGLVEHADELVALRRDSVELHPAEGRTGCSRIGGLPDFPPGALWPHGREEPMVFLAQIDLAEVGGLDAEGLLPTSGLLQVFADLASVEPWFEDGGRPAVQVVVQAADPRVLAAAPPPAGCEVFPARAVGPARGGVCLPPLDGPFYERMVPEDADAEDWFGILDLLDRYHPPLDDRDRPRHRMLGYPDPLQGDPWARCRAAEPDTPDEAWQLLVQIDSAPDAQLGDNGLIYVMIPRDALTARDFTRARGEWQMH